MALRNEIDGAAAAGVRYFASGSNHPGEILGFAACGIDVGVAAQDLHSLGALAIEEAALRYGARVFVDSGAFSEIGFGPQGPYVAEPISNAEWKRRLGLYIDLAGRIGSKLYCVAPDMVAFQAETLDRMAQWGYLVRAAARRGANVLVPCQKGAIPLAEFWTLARQILGIPETQLVAAVPMKKDATSTEELAAFLAEAKPLRVHLLGLGPKSDRYEEVMAAVRAASPGTEVFCDSVMITSLVGRNNGKGGGPRPLTAMTDVVQAELDETVWGECGDLDYTDAIAQPSTWMNEAQVRKLGKEVGLCGRALTAFCANPDGWLAEDMNWAMPHVEAALEAAWSAHATGNGNTTARKRETIERLFGAESEAA